MATWNGGGGGGEESGGEENDDFMKPSPSQLLLVPKPPEELCPDSEENVREQTEDVFRNFVYQRYRNDNIQQSYNNLHVEPEVVNLPRIPDSPAAEVGRQLARIGDDINEKYKDTFNEMIRSMNIRPDSDTAYEVFAGVAKKIFADGVNWGRIVTLLCFGYRMAIQVLQHHWGKCKDFLHRIGQFLLKFLITERISRWIADHGGWRGALTFTPSVSGRTIATIVSLAAMSVMAVIAWNRYYL